MDRLSKDEIYNLRCVVDLGGSYTIQTWMLRELLDNYRPPDMMQEIVNDAVRAAVCDGPPETKP